jgi:hypothetical protein
MRYTVNYPNEHNRVAAHAEPITIEINGFRLTVTAGALSAEPDDEYADVMLPAARWNRHCGRGRPKANSSTECR